MSVETSQRFLAENGSGPERPAEDTVLVTSLPTPRTAQIRTWGIGIVVAVVVVALIAAAAIRTAGSGSVTSSGDESSTTSSDGSLDHRPAGSATSEVASSAGEGASPTGEEGERGGEIVAGTAGPATNVDTGAAGAAEASRFVDIATTRVLDTRSTSPVVPGGTASVNVGAQVPAEASAVAVTVSVLAPETTGLVTAALDAGPVTVADLASPMASNVVFVPRDTGEDLTITSVPGGHVVVDVIGYFVPSGPTAGGRFVPVAPQAIGRLWTETQGREVTLSPLGDGGPLPSEGVASLLVRVRADVGDEGGEVRIGPDPDDLVNVTLWAPTTEGDRTRQGLALVTLDELGQLSLAYEGGVEINIDVLGYVTSDDAEVSSAGLYVPVDPTVLVGDTIGARQPLTVDPAAALGLQEAPAAVMLTVIAQSERPGELLTYSPTQGQPRSATLNLGDGFRSGATITPASADGTVVVFTDVEAEVTIETTGYFLAG